jgi:hypothetical protein
VVLEALSLTNAYHTIYACCVYSKLARAFGPRTLR